jgi:hypothetical protein
MATREFNHNKIDKNITDLLPLSEIKIENDSNFSKIIEYIYTYLEGSDKSDLPDITSN